MKNSKELELEQGSFDDFNKTDEETVQPNSRYGKLFVKESWYTQGNKEEIHALFKHFLPTRIEFLYHAHIFEMFGYSEMFDEMFVGEDVFPVYDIFIENGEVFFERRLV